ncbi:MAG: ATP-binding protein [Dermatophilaceae bacterium]
MAAPSYLPRLVDDQLARGLRAAGAVLLEGPKACGKTSTATRQAKSSVRLDASPQIRVAALADATIVLPGAVPHLIDEWQLVPESWNAVRAEIDTRQESGQFILTGSATPVDDITRHSGAGRFTRVRMGPMSLFESHDSAGGVCVGTLLDGERPVASTGPDATLADVAAILCRGGWPANLNREQDDAAAFNRDYLTSLGGADLLTLDGVRRDPRKIRLVLHALARSAGTYVSNKTLIADSAGTGEPLNPRTLSSYIDALARLWVYVEQPAWGQHLRSTVPVRKSPKRHLVDPSLAAAALGASPKSLVRDPQTFGQLFESMVYRDLVVYAQAAGAEVFAYQDNNGAEIDAVLVRDGAWAGVEVKLSGAPDVLNIAAAGLLRIADVMRTKPESLTIITATGPSYTRPDGVNVASILDLGP